jgi:hypothetical protein
VNNISVWIKHLHHPLVFAGFGLFLFALIIKPLFLNNSKLTGTATERLLHRAMLLLFLLAAIAVAGGIALNWKDSSADERQTKTPAASAEPVVQQPVTEQKNAAVAPEKRNSLSITASEQGEVSIGGDLINADGNVEKNDEQ